MNALAEFLRCPRCGAVLTVSGADASCGRHVFPVEGGIPRLLPEDLMRVREGHSGTDIRARTYRSFGFEWSTFSSQLSVYGDNFRWYLEPLRDEPLEGRLVLDAGCGMGRHTHHFLAHGAQVLAVDASPAVDMALANNPSDRALFLQADLLHLPLESGICDVASCLGVLHHLEEAAAGIKELVRVVRQGGWVLIYVYHDPTDSSVVRRWLLAAVDQTRRFTTHMPLPLLRSLTLALAALLYAGYVLPGKLLAKVATLRPKVAGLPLGQYIDYPFRVLWNDQFDRFSAPLEKRYRREAVLALLEEAGLQEVRILGGYGWRAAGRKAAAGPRTASTLL